MRPVVVAVAVCLLAGACTDDSPRNAPPASTSTARAAPTLARPPDVLYEAPTVYRQPVPMVTTEATVRGEPADGYSSTFGMGLEGIDWVAMTLGFMAFIAVAGLIPFWAYVLSVMGR